MTRYLVLLVITTTILFSCSPRVDKGQIPSAKGPARPAKSYVKSELVVDPVQDSSGKQLFVKMPDGNLIPYHSPLAIGPGHVSSQMLTGFAQFKATLHPATASQVDLRPFQTPNRTQGTLDNCYHMALVGAIEAAYKTRCLLDVAHTISEPYCEGYRSTPVRELSLSVWQLVRDMAVQSSTHDPAAPHENVCLVCDAVANDSTTGWKGDAQMLATMRALKLAEESEAPYLRLGSNFQLDWFLQQESFILGSPGMSGVTWIPSNPAFLFCDEQYGQGTIQERYDNLYFDPLYVPYGASYNARFGIEKLVVVPGSEAASSATLELFLANSYTTAIAFSFLGLVTADDTLNGATVCDYMGDHITSEQSFAQGVGHWMLLVGYDRISRRFLLKNSWGDNYPYLSVPYAFLERRATGGYIVVSVFPEQAGADLHESAYLGMWHVFKNDGAYRGRLVIHRTRSTPDELPGYSPGGSGTPFVMEDERLKELTRLGTFYRYADGAYGKGEWIAGQLNPSGRLKLYKGRQVGTGGDGWGTEYLGSHFWQLGGESWGTMVVISADEARDGLNQSYVRDFYRRATNNWIGPWDIKTGFRSTTSIFLTDVDRVPSVDGKYQIRGYLIKGSPDDGAVTNVTGIVDSGGSHARLKMYTGPAVADTCILDARFARTVESDSVLDKIVSGSTLQCGGGAPTAVTGKRRAISAPD
jgi:hypothetical protein